MWQKYLYLLHCSLAPIPYHPTSLFFAELYREMDLKGDEAFLGGSVGVPVQIGGQTLTSLKCWAIYVLLTVLLVGCSPREHALCRHSSG